LTLSNESRDRVRHVFEPIVRAMGRAGLTPDALTLIGFGITVVGAVLVGMQQWLLGGLVIFLGGVFDMFDGTLARATGRVSNLGAFMDSVFDRAGEVIVYFGMTVGSLTFWGQSETNFGLGAFLAPAAMGSAFMVSYVRAKAESLGFTTGTGMAAVGLMPREVRLVILSLGLMLAGWSVRGNTSFPDVHFFDIGGFLLNLEAGHGYLALALGIITIGSIITTIQRILHVRSQARQQAACQSTENHT